MARSRSRPAPFEALEALWRPRRPLWQGLSLEFELQDARRSSSARPACSRFLRSSKRASSTRSIALSGRNRSEMCGAKGGGCDQGAVADADLVVRSKRSRRPRKMEMCPRPLVVANQAGSAAPGRRPSRCACGTRPASSRRCNAARHGKHGLEHVARVNRPFGGPGADDRVQLVDEEDDLAFGVGDLLQDGLRRSRNSPRYFVRRSSRPGRGRPGAGASVSGTSPRTIRWASPSTRRLADAGLRR